jgi:hypothetical protein
MGLVDLPLTRETTVDRHCLRDLDAGVFDGAS